VSAIDHRKGQALPLPFYYGWLVLAGSAVSEMIAIGATSYSAGLFVLPLQAEFHISRASASSPVSILFLGAMVFAPFAGRILDVWPIRRAMLLGALLLGTAMAVIAFASQLWVMMLALLLPAAFGFILLGPVTTATLVSRWFYRRRGLALGFAAVATSGGGFTVVPLMSRAIQHYGWRSALLQEAAVFAIVSVLLALFVLKDRPADLGLENDPAFERPPNQNESLDAASLEFLRLMNGYIGSRGPLRFRLHTLLAKIGKGPLMTLPAETLAEFMRDLHESNRQVAEEYFGGARDDSDDPLFAPLKFSRPRVEQPQMTLDDAVKMMARVWAGANEDVEGGLLDTLEREVSERQRLRRKAPPPNLNRIQRKKERKEKKAALKRANAETPSAP